MERAEAIAMLKSKMDGSVDTSYEWAETVRMAIEALSAEAVSREDTVTLTGPISIQAEMVAVVRCKDCRHGQYDATHYFCAEHHHKVYEDDYCSHGQRLSNFGERKGGDGK